MSERTLSEAVSNDEANDPAGAGSHRREFLARLAGLSGAGWLAVHAPAVLAAGEAAAKSRAAGAGWSHLSPAEAATIAALVDQIIPPDDLPGAAEIGVVHFIDQALGGFLADTASDLKAGLADLDRRAQHVSPRPAGFAALPVADQTLLLQQVENTPFFRQAILLTHCGLFALPSWGGNRNQAGWQLLGFDSRHAWQPPFGYYDVAEHAGVESGAGAHDAG